jgi:hypothetical protein
VKSAEKVAQEETSGEPVSQGEKIAKP